MNMKPFRRYAAACLLTCGIALPLFPQAASGAPRIVSRDVSQKRPQLYLATYADGNNARLIAPGRISGNNGDTWKSFKPSPDFDSALPYGFRRNTTLTMFDPAAKRLLTVLNALDTPGLDPKTPEPAIALSQYYLRYRVSKDGGRTWLFDEPIVAAGDHTAEHPIKDVDRGRNALFLGDSGSTPLSIRSGRVLVPAQVTLVGQDGNLVNPYRQPSYTKIVVLSGTWQPDSRLQWQASEPLSVGEDRSTRGLIEPTLAQLPDGRVLIVMRGSNAGKPDLPGYRWYAVSSDDGRTWSDPQPWAYENGKRFYSPSSMSVLVRHSSGRVFWVGNICDKNPHGNDPRWPVVLGEVDPDTALLKRDSVIELDTRQSEDNARGRELVGKNNARLDLSHFWALEDRRTGEILVIFSRLFASKKADWVTLRVSIT